jgi:hypothetical protein
LAYAEIEFLNFVDVLMTAGIGRPTDIPGFSAGGDRTDRHLGGLQAA